MNDANDFTIDPFTQVYNRIWEVFEDNVDFCALIKEGNRIKFTTEKTTPMKKQAIDADYPEVSLIPRGGESPSAISSTSAEFDRVFSLVIVSGTLRADKYLFPTEWLSLKILSNQSDSLGLIFVKKFRVGPSDWRVNDPEFTKGKEGWFSVIDINVGIVIPRSDLSI